MHGDNLPRLRAINSGCVDLIATDPPFNKGRDFHSTPESLKKDKGGSFQDRWSWKKDVQQAWCDTIKEEHRAVWGVIDAAKVSHSPGMGAFLCFLAVRIMEMHRILKPTGSLYLHCDPTASHYIKAILDAIFGAKNFRNELIWKRNNGAGKSSQHAPKSWGRNTDSILYYAASGDTPVRPYRKATIEEINSRFPFVDDRGERYADDKGLFRGATLGPRPNLCYEWRGFKNPHSSGWQVSKEVLEKEYARGDAIIKNGTVKRLKWARDFPGVHLDNLWNDIPMATKKERVNYPTQKPIDLYARIIEASSEKKDVVLDPFCGCATTLIAAESLKRKWIGIDLWENAGNLLKDRMVDEQLAIKGTPPSSGMGHGLFAEEIVLTNELPMRTDDDRKAVPAFKTQRRYYLEEPPGPKMSREEMIRELLRIQGGLAQCQGCDVVFDHPRFLELDHNTPRSQRGINHISNRVLLCGPCNRAKSDDKTLKGLRKKNKEDGVMAWQLSKTPALG